MANAGFRGFCLLAIATVFAAGCQKKAPDEATAGDKPVVAAGAAGPDLIIRGGPILTMEGDTAAYVEAVVVDDGKIAFAGAEAEALKLKADGTVVKDLGGKALLPGFIDPHGHMIGGGVQSVSANLLAPPDGAVTDIPSLLATMKDWFAKNTEGATKANLILGFGYDNSQLKEQRHPTKEELDEVSKDIPVLVIHQSSHLASMNSAALKVVGYDSTTQDPAGGVIQRKPGTTEPNGTVEETAFNGALLKLASGVGPESIPGFIAAGAKLWAKYGYTTAQEGRAVPSQVAALRKAADAGLLPIDVAAYVDVQAARDFAKENFSAEYRNHFRVAGVKLGIDGSPQGFTAWRDKPYYAPVGNYPKGYSGYAAAAPEQVNDAVDWAYANNMQILVHAGGEKALDAFIDAATAAEAKHGKADRRPVLIHGHFERPDQVAKVVALGIVPSLFPMHTFYWGDWHHDHTVGPEAAQNISPTMWYRKAGAIFTTHHDAPVAFPDSMRVLDATVNRVSRSGRVIGPDQRVDTYTALRAMTIWAAYQQFEEGTKGSIKPGKLADFVVLSADPLKTEPRQLASLKVGDNRGITPATGRE